MAVTAVATRGFGLPFLAKWAGQALGLTSKASKAYEVASQGGRHAGFLRTAMQRSNAQLERSFKNGMARAREHLGYLKDPAKAVTEKGGNWSNMSQKEREGLISYWRKEAENYREQAEISRDILRNRNP